MAQYCSACEVNADNKVVCTTCVSGASLLNGGCLVCDSSCSTCDLKPTNCTACPAGKVLSARTDESKACVDNADCPITNCHTCSTEVFSGGYK